MIVNGLWNTDTETHTLCLVGRVLTSKAYRFEAFSTSIKGMLNPVKGMDCQKLAGGRFLLRFNHIIDRDRALEGSLWSFDRNIVVLNMIQAHENPLHVDLNWFDFHVHVHDLPLSKMNLGVASYSGNRLGRFKEMDMDESSCSWGAILYMQVSLDVNNPLQRAMKKASSLRGGSIFSSVGFLSFHANPTRRIMVAVELTSNGSRKGQGVTHNSDDCNLAVSEDRMAPQQGNDSDSSQQMDVNEDISGISS
ncbi:hypothetical protein Sango_1888400 [Sesamum angolense]|uniref:DUF4283 domain-containing protein n=1 Tax=Sesamum angolense TaxID=2727404 RepID=A0AAE2BQL4_9LAMI|nr:hypothetical protein Sango_1888400 [Sesamum angolense]